VKTIRSDALLSDSRLFWITAFHDRALHDRAITAGYTACFQRPMRQSQLLRALAPDISPSTRGSRVGAL
jgi:hypothetical protein